MSRGRQFTQAEIDRMAAMFNDPTRRLSAVAVARLFRCSSGTVLRAASGKLKAKDEGEPMTPDTHDSSELSQRIRAQIGLRELRIPPHLHDGLLRYVFDRIRTGSFLQAVLENDLVGASRRADPTSGYAATAIATWLDTYAPDGSWGSRANVEAWIAARKNTRDGE